MRTRNRLARLLSWPATGFSSLLVPQQNSWVKSARYARGSAAPRARDVRRFAEKHREQRRGIILPWRKYTSSSLFRLFGRSKPPPGSRHDSLGIPPFPALRGAKLAHEFCGGASLFGCFHLFKPRFAADRRSSGAAKHFTKGRLSFICAVTGELLLAGARRRGAAVWPHEQDICPDTLYLASHKSAEGMPSRP